MDDDENYVVIHHGSPEDAGWKKTDDPDVYLKPNGDLYRFAPGQSRWLAYCNLPPIGPE